MYWDWGRYLEVLKWLIPSCLAIACTIATVLWILIERELYKSLLIIVSKFIFRHAQEQSNYYYLPSKEEKQCPSSMIIPNNTTRNNANYCNYQDTKKLSTFAHIKRIIWRRATKCK